MDRIVLNELARKAIRDLTSAAALAALTDDDFEQGLPFGLTGYMEAGGTRYTWEFKIFPEDAEDHWQHLSPTEEFTTQEFTKNEGSQADE